LETPIEPGDDGDSLLVTNAGPCKLITVPRVTVIIPTYNWSTVLPYAIGTVLRQTFGDFELLVVGDGCTDDSEQIVKAIRDPRVRWINLPENSRHQSGPNNEGLRQARGEYIAYLGHDDLWLPHHLGAMVDALDRTGADLGYSLIANVAPNGEFIWPTIPRPRAGIFTSPLGILHRKRVTDEMGGWRHYRDVKSTPDVELWQRIQSAGYECRFVPRLTGIKFAAGHRRDVYRARPCHEQAHWAARIAAEPDLETTQMASFIADQAVPLGAPYRVLIRHLLRQSLARVRIHRAGVARWPGLFRQRSGIDEVRRFKGL
jgi:glycosyltransferase involved in cell wall biosynthesis